MTHLRPIATLSLSKSLMSDIWKGKSYWMKFSHPIHCWGFQNMGQMEKQVNNDLHGSPSSPLKLLDTRIWGLLPLEARSEWNTQTRHQLTTSATSVQGHDSEGKRSVTVRAVYDPPIPRLLSPTHFPLHSVQVWEDRWRPRTGRDLVGLHTSTTSLEGKGVDCQYPFPSIFDDLEIEKAAMGSIDFFIWANGSGYKYKDFIVQATLKWTIHLPGTFIKIEIIELFSESIDWIIQLEESPEEMQEIAKTINGRFSGYAGSQLTCRMMDYEIMMDSALNDYYPVINATTMTNFQNFNCDPYLTGKSAL